MKELNVFFYMSPRKKFLVGTLAQVGPKIYFEYAPSFLDNPMWLSPYKLPPEPGLTEYTDFEFGKIFGLFDDSLPDGWGRLLMDRFLRKNGINTDSLSVLDRLSFLGSSTMGALTYEPAIKQQEYNGLIDLQYLSDQSKQILEGETSKALPQLLKAGGSPQGARPKVLVGIYNDLILSGEDDLPAEYEHWIVKFHGKNDFEDAGAVEYTYSLIAKESGLIMAETKLFETDFGDRYFGIKRFDRKKNQRFHVHTLGGLIHSNFRIPECNYMTFLKVVLDLTKNRQDLSRGFKQMIFNVMANNRDDHVKNFAFMIDDQWNWSLTPAYDLTYSTGPGGEHSMDLLGEGRSPGRQQIFKLGEKIGLSKNEIKDSIDQVAAGVTKWSSYAESAGVSKETKSYIQNEINKNLSNFAIKHQRIKQPSQGRKMSGPSM
ncbi:MAG: type II toxin-antitoxin system HipA family toxin [Desulfobacteraceae bacterium]|nr:type II toxin-antitoxin system HipA family toxin [Desulfobacteraceae bacterium]